MRKVMIRIGMELLDCLKWSIQKTLVIATALWLLSRIANAAPTFVTGRMIDRRNGLTDAQYEYLWAQGRRPQIQQQAARDWIYRASRYQNVTNWLDIIGKTNNFAALSYDLQGKNAVLAETNTILVATNRVLDRAVIRLNGEVVEWQTNYNSLWWDYNSATNKQTKVADYLWQKSQTGTIIQKQIYLGIHTWYTNFIAQVENAEAK